MKFSRAGMARWCSFAWVSALPRRNQTMLSSTRGSSSMYRVSSCAAPAQSLRRKAALPRSRAPCAILAFMPTARSSSALASRREMSCRSRWRAWSIASVCPGPSFSEPSRSYARAAFSLASRREASPRRKVSTSCVSCFTLPSFAAASSRAPRISLRAKVKAPRVAIAAKRMYAATLVAMCRFSNCSCLRPMCLSSACRFLTRLRDSITSRRRSERSRSPADWCSTTGGTERGAVISSLIGIPWLALLKGTTAGGLGSIPQGARFPASFSIGRLAGRRWDNRRMARSPSRSGRVSFVLGGEEVEDDPGGEQVAAHVDRVRGAGVGGRGRDAVALLDHAADVVGDPEAETHRHEAHRRIGLEVAGGARDGVQRVAEPAPRVDGVPAALGEGRIELEQDLEAADLERAGALAVLVEAVAQLDASVQLVVELEAEAEQEAGMPQAVLGAGFGLVLAAGDGAQPSQERDGAVALAGHAGQGGRGGEQDAGGSAQAHRFLRRAGRG